MILPNISPPFRELLQKTPNPFVTKIRDAIYTTATFSKGKVVLVGDAFATLRPHIGAATEQAAFHGNTLESVYRGDKPQQVWDTEIRKHAQMIILVNKLVAQLGCGTMFSLTRSIFTLWFFLLKQKLGRRRNSL
ncbi:hypothetical protein F4801DRAFT_585700 [Xylaria longipes]|nr:hypothetical protein F4801DRAFT_585700 [Xylaria longipes]